MLMAILLYFGSSFIMMAFSFAGAQELDPEDPNYD